MKWTQLSPPAKPDAENERANWNLLQKLRVYRQNRRPRPMADYQGIVIAGAFMQVMLLLFSSPEILKGSGI
jgi:hypothetical protein